MKAAFVKSPYKFVIRDVQLPKLKPNDVLVKIKASGICGTDFHTAKSEAKDWQPFGHEIAGVVEEIGSNVENVKKGQSILVESGSFCGTCNDCRNGRVDLCHDRTPNVFSRAEKENLTMGFAEKVIIDKQNALPFEGISFEEASLIEPMGVALDLSYTVEPKLNDDVLVVGLGPIGLMAVQIVRAMGARKVFAAEHSSSKIRIETAKVFGVDDVIQVDKNPISTYEFPRGGLDRALVTAPPSVIPEVVDVMNYGGVVGFIGIDYGEGRFIRFDANKFHFNKTQLRASHAVPALYFPRCIDMIKSGTVKVKPLITHTFKIEEIENMMLKGRDHKDSVIKAVMIN
jgi:threonine dehydrogenase-like Zn-dependent dehydrogenase